MLPPGLGVLRGRVCVGWWGGPASGFGDGATESVRLAHAPPGRGRLLIADVLSVGTLKLEPPGGGEYRTAAVVGMVLEHRDLRHLPNEVDHFDRDSRLAPLDLDQCPVQHDRGFTAAMKHEEQCAPSTLWASRRSEYGTARCNVPMSFSHTSRSYRS